MTHDRQVSRERMKRRLISTRINSGYTYQKPAQVQTRPSERTIGRERRPASERDRLTPFARPQR